MTRTMDGFDLGWTIRTTLFHEIGHGIINYLEKENIAIKKQEEMAESLADDWEKGKEDKNQLFKNLRKFVGLKIR